MVVGAFSIGRTRTRRGSRAGIAMVGQTVGGLVRRTRSRTGRQNKLEKEKQEAKAKGKEDIEDSVGTVWNGVTHNETAPKGKERHKDPEREEQGKAVQVEDKEKEKVKAKGDFEDSVGRACSGATLRETAPGARAQTKWHRIRTQ